MQRWILVCLLAVLSVVLVTEYHSQEETNPVSQQQDCRYQIIAPAATNATTFLLNPCSGDTWKYDFGYNYVTKEWDHDPQWERMGRD